jgi:hypothetical protein
MAAERQQVAERLRDTARTVFDWPESQPEQPAAMDSPSPGTTCSW